MAYLGKTLETASGFTIVVVRHYAIECEDCGPIYTHGDGYTVPKTRADALQLQREHYTSHAKWDKVS